MANIHPSIENLHLTSPGAYRERDILEILRDGLPPNFDVFHSVEWESIYQDQQKFGEIDIVVLSPMGHIALLEVKAGELSFEEDNAFKQYGQEKKNITKQIKSQIASWISRINSDGFPGVRVGHFLVLPDQRVQNSSVLHPRERIIDSKDLPELCSKIKQSFPVDSVSASIREKLQAYIENRLEIAPDPSTRINQANRLSTKLSDGLATWVPRISHEGGVFKVQATAGSGKTQLAIKLLKDAADKNIRAMYVCYNRPLADHILKFAPTKIEVTTFHELSINHYRRTVSEPDFTDPKIFEEAADHFVAESSSFDPTLDLLIVDEYQDFEPNWLISLASKLKDKSNFYILGDSQQDLYGRDDFEIDQAVKVFSNDNFRSPQKIVDAINQFSLTPTPIKSKSPIVGDIPDFRIYTGSDDSSLKEVERAVKDLIAQGFQASDITILSFSGRNNSKILNGDKVGKIPLNRFTGSYDKNGNPLWAQGEILAETIYRFKGQSAPVVILCEIDFEELSEKVKRKLFVGMTRAQLHLVCIMSERSMHALEKALQD